MKFCVSLCLLLSFFLTSFGQDYALKQLEKSPRHGEWVNLPNGKRSVHCFVVYPEKSTKALVAIIIHENRGLTDWVRSFADQLAAQGYITIAPDLLSDFDSLHSATSSFPNSDEARDAIYKLPAEQVMSDLNTVEQYAEKIPSGNGKTVSIGFCWGGSQSFHFATVNKKIKAALVFYGTAPDSDEAISAISAPVYGFYGGDDERIAAGIPDTESRMKAAGKKYEYVIYQGAGHAFMRRGDDPETKDGNRTARDESWKRMLKILSGI